MVEHRKHGVSRLSDVHRPDIGEAVRHLRQELVARAHLARLLGWPPLVVVEPAHEQRQLRAQGRRQTDRQGGPPRPPHPPPTPPPPPSAPPLPGPNPSHPPS